MAATNDVEFDARTVTVTPSKLNEYLVCSLCRGYLRDAQTIPECLHSFCKSCIYRHFLVQGSRNCPKCFLTLKPRPITTLISDQRLQDIVDKIFPDFNEQDAIQEKEFYKIHGFKRKPESQSSQSNQSHNNSHAKKSASQTSNGASGRNSTKSSPINRSTGVEEYEIEIHPLESQSNDALPAVTRRFLRAEAQFKMFELRKFIAKQLGLESQPQRELEITCMGSIVGPELSVQFIQKTFWQQQHERNEPIVLHYRLVAAP